MQYPWAHQRRFNAYSEYFKREFGGRVQKVSVNAGFTCPNRDGTKGTGGCTYCNNDAFNPSYCSPSKSIRQQIEEGIEFHSRRYRRAEKFLVYFQAFSNTYAPLEKLMEIYDQALKVENVAGLVIGTRPDCVDNEKLEYFARLASKKYLIIEYGVETSNDNTLQIINRGHTFAETIDALTKTAAKGLKTGIHLIFGLPGETRQEMIEQAAIFSKLPVNTLKIHQLQIVSGTKMAVQYKNNPAMFTFFTLDEYIDLVVDFIEKLNPAIVIERFAGEVPPRFLAGPNWGPMRYDFILQKIENRLLERDTWQGRLF